MASLIELRTIYTNATTYVDPQAPTQNEIDAHALLNRFEAYLWQRAAALMSQADASPDLRNLKLAHRVMVDSREMARRMLIILLGSTTAAGATVAQILTSSDTAVAAAIDNVAPQVALALVQPGAR